MWKELIPVMSQPSVTGEKRRVKFSQSTYYMIKITI